MSRCNTYGSREDRTADARLRPAFRGALSPLRPHFTPRCWMLGTVRSKYGKAGNAVRIGLGKTARSKKGSFSRLLHH